MTQSEMFTEHPTPTEDQRQYLLSGPPPRKPEPDFDIDYADGAQTEAWVRDVLITALREQRVETKLDRGFVETGNIFVETECHKKNGWEPSGIDNPDTARIWVYDLSRTGVLVVFDIDVLRRLAYDERVGRAKAAPRDQKNPARGRLVNMRKVFTQGILSRMSQEATGASLSDAGGVPGAGTPRNGSDAEVAP